MEDIQTSLQLTAGLGKEKRRELDFYPTPPECTVALMDFLKLDKSIKIWEPACGNGAMSRVLESYGHTVVSSDISDECYMFPNIDFLGCHASSTIVLGSGAIITNPPFNRCEEFILKAHELIGSLESYTIAILHKSQYWHAKKRVDLFRKFPPSYVLPLTWRPDFLNGERGGAPTMECCWTVWDNEGHGVTKYELLEKPKP